MRVLLQRVCEASVSLGSQRHTAIGPGLLILHGVAAEDTPEDLAWLAGKVARLRLFEDEAGVMNRSLVETGGEALVVSQFTLLASTKKGNRPSWLGAARPEVAEPLYEAFARELAAQRGRPVATGVFGADMQVALVNDGPVTIWIDSRNRE